MGGGTFTKETFRSYSKSCGKMYDDTTGYVSGQKYTARGLDSSLNPHKVVRECVNSKEHPNTIPVILALDVTGSMGAACQKTAEALGVIMTSLYEKYKDIEFLIMGIGDLAYDNAPIQASQFESDVRIAEALDKLYMEHGGGGNNYESYTAAWWFGLNQTKLDCFDKQGRKGVIITMGDETLNPYLPRIPLESTTGITCQGDVDTSELYGEVIKKFDIFHISIDDPSSSYSRRKESIDNSWSLLGQNYMVSTINSLPQKIEDCISNSVSGTVTEQKVTTSSAEGISW